MTSIHPGIFVFVAGLFFASTSYAAVEFRVDNKTAPSSTQVTVPVRVSNFVMILSVQGTLQFDTNIITYSSTGQYGLPGMGASNFGTSQVSNGLLTFLWDDNTLNGLTLPDTTVIFSVTFNVVGLSGQQSLICFANSPTALEVIDTSFSAVLADFYCGSVQIPGGSAPVANITKSDVTCFGANDGSAWVSVSGGTMPYTYSWSNGSTQDSISNLPPDTYSLTVTDAANATVTGSITITQPASALSINTSHTDVTVCGANDGTATAFVSGGTPSYSYSWSGGAITATANNLAGGTYTVTVTDANGCTITGSVTVSQPSNISVSISKQDVLCYGDNSGSAVITATGGTPPYNYGWSFGATTRTVTGLVAGIYTVTVSDASSCQVVEQVIIQEPALLVATGNVIDASCFGYNDGRATVSATGGAGGYSYLWSTGGTNATISNLAPGNYGVSVTDANGCTISDAVTVAQPNALVLSLSVTHVTTNGGSDGAIDLSVSGGTSPYTYSWSNGATTQDVSNLTAGGYSVIVTDDNGCTGTDSALVTEPVSVFDLTGSVGITIFPNPNNGNFTIMIEGKEPKDLQLMNILGQVAYSTTLNSSAFPGNRISIQTQLPEGMYVILLDGMLYSHDKIMVRK